MEITLNANFLAMENDDLELINGGLTAEQWVTTVCWVTGTLIGTAICTDVSWIFGELC